MIHPMNWMVQVRLVLSKVLRLRPQSRLLRQLGLQQLLRLLRLLRLKYCAWLRQHLRGMPTSLLAHLLVFGGNKVRHAYSTCRYANRPNGAHSCSVQYASLTTAGLHVVSPTTNVHVCRKALPYSADESFCRDGLVLRNGTGGTMATPSTNKQVVCSFAIVAPILNLGAHRMLIGS